MTDENETPAGAGKALDETWNRLRENDAETHSDGLTDDASGAQDDDLSEDELEENDLEDDDDADLDDPLNEAPAEDGTDDPDATSDTLRQPGSPSEYDRQRDASGLGRSTLATDGFGH